MMMRSLSPALVSIIVAGFAISPAAAQGPSRRFNSGAPRAKWTAVDIFAKRQQTIAVLLTYDVRGRALARASGVVLSADGLVATNAHTIKDASVVEVRIDGQTYTVDAVLDEDADSDVCILKVAAAHLAAVPLADRLPPVGSDVVAIGNPSGFELTVSKGLLSGIREDVTRSEMWIQHTAAISRGSSGGALFDDYGNLIGLTTEYQADSQNLNFAITADTVKESRRRALIKETPATVRALTLSRTSEIITAMAAAVAGKEAAQLTSLADRLDRIRVDDPHTIVSLGIAAFLNGEYADTRTALLRAAGATLEPEWARTAKFYLAATYDKQLRGGDASVTRVQTLDAITQFLSTSPPSLLNQSDDTQSVEWAKGLQRGLLEDSVAAAAPTRRPPTGFEHPN